MDQGGNELRDESELNQQGAGGWSKWSLTDQLVNGTPDPNKMPRASKLLLHRNHPLRTVAQPPLVSTTLPAFQPSVHTNSLFSVSSYSAFSTDAIALCLLRFSAFYIQPHFFLCTLYILLKLSTFIWSKDISKAIWLMNKQESLSNYLFLK